MTNVEGALDEGDEHPRDPLEGVVLGGHPRDEQADGGDPEDGCGGGLADSQEEEEEVGADEDAGERVVELGPCRVPQEEGEGPAGDEYELDSLGEEEELQADEEGEGAREEDAAGLVAAEGAGDGGAWRVLDRVEEDEGAQLERGHRRGDVCRIHLLS